MSFHFQRITIWLPRLAAFCGTFLWQKEHGMDLNFDQMFWTDFLELTDHHTPSGSKLPGSIIVKVWLIISELCSLLTGSRNTRCSHIHRTFDQTALCCASQVHWNPSVYYSMLCIPIRRVAWIASESPIAVWSSQEYTYYTTYMYAWLVLLSWQTINIL